MRYAAVRRTGQVVDAFRARRGADFACPNCGGRVHLRSGTRREKHFAHNPGEGTEACEEYHPSSGIVAESPAKTEASVEDDLTQLGLVADIEGRAWSLSLRLPELPAEDLAGAPLTTLRDGIIDVFAGSTLASRIAALEVRPGVGISRASVPPSLQAYRTVPSGSWPANIDTSRWRATAQPLSAIGALFRLRAGEWARPSGRSVRPGEELVLVADERCSPPAATAPAGAQSVVASGLRWRLWRLRIPVDPPFQVTAWLDSLGFQLDPWSWAVNTLSIPAGPGSGRGLQFWEDERLIVRISAPGTRSSATLLVELGTNRYFTTIEASAQDPLYIALEPSGASSGRVEVAAEKQSSLSFEFVKRPTSSDLKERLASALRLRLWIGDVLTSSWNSASGSVSRKGAIRIDGVPESTRLEVIVQLESGRRILADCSVRDAETVVASALAEAVSIRLDAGNAGFVDVRLTALEQVSLERQPVDRWIAVAAFGANARNQIPTWVRESNSKSAFLTADLALLAQLRSRASHRRRSGGRSA